MEDSGTTIFEVTSRLAAEHQAINLGQGFPEDGFPQDVIEAAAQALREGSNQYPPMLGLPSLRQAAAAHDKHFYGIDVDWQTDVMVTSGATEALAATLLALVEPGAEVILFEPAYDAYGPSIRRAGGIPKPIALVPPAWEIPWPALQQQMSSKTRAIVLNTPHNPTGRMLSRADLEKVAALAQQHDCTVVCDEVYEHLIFDGRRHEPLMTLPNMFQRTVRIASAGKTFSLTGWKVGYVVAPKALLKRIAQVHQFLVFTTPPNLQQAIAYGLAKPPTYFSAMAAALQNKRDRFVSGLHALGLATTPCDGTYFVTLDARSSGYEGTSRDFCKDMIETGGVAAIPLTAFYEALTDSPYVRFCFAKQDQRLDEALARLQRFLKTKNLTQHP